MEHAFLRNSFYIIGQEAQESVQKVSNLTSLKIDKSILQEELEQVRKAHAEQMENMDDVFTDLKHKDQELEKVKLFSEAQSAELKKVKHDFHQSEKESRHALEKAEFDAKRELNAANAKIEDLQGEIITNLKSDLSNLKEVNETLKTKSKEAIAKVQENKEMMEGKYKQNVDDLNKEIVELKENLDKAQSLNESLSMKSSTSSTNLQDEDELSADIQL